MGETYVCCFFSSRGLQLPLSKFSERANVRECGNSLCCDDSIAILDFFSYVFRNRTVMTGPKTKLPSLTVHNTPACVHHPTLINSFFLALKNRAPPAVSEHPSSLRCLPPPPPPNFFSPKNAITDRGVFDKVNLPYEPAGTRRGLYPFHITSSASLNKAYTSGVFCPQRDLHRLSSFFPRTSIVGPPMNR